MERDVQGDQPIGVSRKDEHVGAMDPGIYDHSLRISNKELSKGNELSCQGNGSVEGTFENGKPSQLPNDSHSLDDSGALEDVSESIEGGRVENDGLTSDGWKEPHLSTEVKSEQHQDYQKTAENGGKRQSGLEDQQYHSTEVNEEPLQSHQDLVESSPRNQAEHQVNDSRDRHQGNELEPGSIQGNQMKEISDHGTDGIRESDHEPHHSNEFKDQGYGVKESLYENTNDVSLEENAHSANVLGQDVEMKDKLHRCYEANGSSYHDSKDESSASLEGTTESAARQPHQGSVLQEHDDSKVGSDEGKVMKENLHRSADVKITIPAEGNGEFPVTLAADHKKKEPPSGLGLEETLRQDNGNMKRRSNVSAEKATEDSTLSVTGSTSPSDNMSEVNDRSKDGNSASPNQDEESDSAEHKHQVKVLNGHGKNLPHRKNLNLNGHGRFAASGIPLIRRIEMLELNLGVLEDKCSPRSITDGSWSARSGPWSAHSSCVSTPTSNERRRSLGSLGFSTPTSLDPRCKSIDDVLEETEEKGTLVERVNHLEERFISISSQLEKEPALPVQPSPDSPLQTSKGSPSQPSPDSPLQTSKSTPSQPSPDSTLEASKTFVDSQQPLEHALSSVDEKLEVLTNDANSAEESKPSSFDETKQNGDHKLSENDAKSAGDFQPSAYETKQNSNYEMKDNSEETKPKENAEEMKPKVVEQSTDTGMHEAKGRRKHKEKGRKIPNFLRSCIFAH